MQLNYKQRMEFANAISHGLAALFYLVAVPFVLSMAAFHGGSSALVMSVSIYGFSLLLVFFASTLYHAIPVLKYKSTLRILDHIAIFFLIAGSYTPFLIRYLGLIHAVPYLGIVWGITLVGAVFKLFFTGKFKAFSVGLYVIQGCLILFFGAEVLSKMSDIVFKLVLTGGIFYLFGVVFYMWQKFPFHHTVWHAFVFLGSLAHFVAITYAVIYA